MKELLWNFFKTGLDAPRISDSAEVKRIFNRTRCQVFVSITIGYAFYYIIRQSYSVIKKPLLASGVVDPAQIGIIGSVFFITYGLGKFTNSFLADRMNNKRFFTFGLFISSVTMAGMGLVNSFVPLAVLWGINGWFQSYGAGPAIDSAARSTVSGSQAIISVLPLHTLPLPQSLRHTAGAWASSQRASSACWAPLSSITQ